MNHFIEIDQDQKGNKFLIIHSGSRNLGNQVAKYYQELAIESCNKEKKYFAEKEKIVKDYKSQGRENEIQNAIKQIKLEPNLPNDLCYLEGQLKEDYLHDMKICQEYAQKNRLTIAKSILCNYFQVPYYYGYNSLRLKEISQSNTFKTMDVVEYDFRYFETIHNYIDLDNNIIRKGAISAQKGELLLIPINMKDGCILGKGKGNKDWNMSAPHGAGRLMSRTKAREVLKLNDMQEDMKDVYTTSVNKNTLDEAPAAYKPIKDIVDNINDTVEILDILKPIYNYKDS